MQGEVAPARVVLASRWWWRWGRPHAGVGVAVSQSACGRGGTTGRCPGCLVLPSLAGLGCTQDGGRWLARVGSSPSRPSASGRAPVSGSFCRCVFVRVWCYGGFVTSGLGELSVPFSLSSCALSWGTWTSGFQYFVFLSVSTCAVLAPLMARAGPCANRPSSAFCHREVGLWLGTGEQGAAL